VAVAAFPGAQVLDVTGPLEVFARASRVLVEQGRPPAYRTEIVSRRRGLLETMGGIRLGVDRTIGEVRGGVDTLLVAGGEVAGAMRDPAILAWLRRLAPRVRRLGAVCTGSFLLAEAGLLDGRRATTHWRSCDVMARRYPRVTVDPDPIFVRDGRIYTSAGVTAGMDLALALVEEDLGRALALEVARGLVLFLRRPGGQSQFSAQLSRQIADREPLRELQAWMADHVAADLSIGALASQVAMSPRNFARVFRREVGMTPARYVEVLRVEAARRRLEESEDGLDRVAADSGFGHPESMRRVFQKHLRVTPGAYRERFRGAPPRRAVGA
jgi:transcriptional regulator GlxA family with amidase domain